jgi:Predicted membrane protein
MAQKKPVKRLKKGGRGGRGGRGGGGGSNKPGSTQASGDGSNKPGGGGPSGGFSSAGKNLGGGGGGGNVAAPIGGGGGGGIPAPTKGGGGISTPAGGFGGEALPPGVSPQVAAGALAQLTGGKVDLRGIAGVPRGPGAPLARDALTKQGPTGALTPATPLDLPQPGVLPPFDPARSPVTSLTPEQIAEIEAGAFATRMDYALPNLAPDAVFTRPMMNPEGLPLQGPPMPPGMTPPDAVTYGPLPGETQESFERRRAAQKIMDRYNMETA